MKRVTAIVAMTASLLGLASPALSAIQLTPIVSSGISSPVFVGNAGDGSYRLFIVERAGIIRVLQNGTSTPTVFLDIRPKIVSGGEQGLLGLAFHPLYSINRRFFVYYTRAGTAPSSSPSTKPRWPTGTLRIQPRRFC